VITIFQIITFMKLSSIAVEVITVKVIS